MEEKVNLGEGVERWVRIPPMTKSRKMTLKHRFEEGEDKYVKDFRGTGA